MPIPSTVSDLSTTASSNYPSGSESANQLDDYHRALCSIVRQVSDAKEDAGVAATAITAERTAVATLTNKTLTAPALGTPVSGNLANCTFPTLNQNTSGTAAGLSATLAVGKGGTGLTSPGASGNVLTSNGSAWVSSAGVGIGVGQTWQNVTGSRAGGVTYTNSTGKPIEVVIKIGGLAEISPVVGGVTVGPFYVSASFIVPDSTTYIATLGAALVGWQELR